MAAMGAIFSLQLATQRFDMQLHGDFLQLQLARDFFIGQPPAQALKDLHLTL